MRSIAKIVICAAVLLALPASRCNAEDRFESVREFIRAEQIRQQLPSVALAVAKGGRIVWEEGFGFANLDRRTKATEHTPYRICSVSKVLTGTALMILVERGKIALDRPVNDYLNGAQLVARVGDARDATVRRLANHTSGLPMHEQVFYEGERYAPTAEDRIENHIAHYGNIIWAPGEHPQYSNLAFGILSHVVAEQSGQTFAGFMEKEIFDPIGMEQSSVGLSDELKSHAATGHVEGKPVPLVTNVTLGAGDIWCSAHDLARFGMLHLKNGLLVQQSILSEQSLDEMKVTTSRVPGSDFGVGWGTDSNYRGTGYFAVGHHGGNVGWHALLLLIPSEDVAVAILCNANGQILDPTADRILSILIPDFAEKRASHLKKRASAGKSNSGRSTSKAIPEDAIGKWAGKVHTYEGSIPITMNFDRSGRGHARIGNQPEKPIVSGRFRGDSFTGDLTAEINTADTRRLPAGILELDLRIRRKSITGAIYANSLYGNPEYGGYRLNHWVELTKVATAKD